MTNNLYEFELPGASHWSLVLRRGLQLKLNDVNGGANVGMMFYNPLDKLERYNAPDTLKCQHTFKLTRGNCLYSDMGRIFCSIIEDDHGWHESVCGNITKAMVEKRWGKVDYQKARNEWQQNGFDAFLVELAKYGLNERDLGSNLNLFSKVAVAESGDMSLVENSSPPNSSLTLRFEMDTLVVMHTCPHPLNKSANYPRKPVFCEISQAAEVGADDYCLNFRDENKRGFENNRLYYLGAGGVL